MLFAALRSPNPALDTYRLLLLQLFCEKAKVLAHAARQLACALLDLLHRSRSGPSPPTSRSTASAWMRRPTATWCRASRCRARAACGSCAATEMTQAYRDDACCLLAAMIPFRKGEEMIIKYFTCTRVTNLPGMIYDIIQMGEEESAHTCAPAAFLCEFGAQTLQSCAPVSYALQQP